MNTEDNPLGEDILHFVVPNSTAPELFRRLGYALPPSDASDLMVYEVSEMIRRSPQDVFRTLLDISSSQVNSKPISDQDRITQLEKELEETKRLVRNIPSRFTMDPMQRSAQAMLSLFVSLIIVFVVLAFASSRKSTPAWQNQKKELISTGDGNRMITLYEDFTAETTDAKGVRRQATEDEKSVVESVYISNEFAKQRR